MIAHTSCCGWMLGFIVLVQYSEVNVWLKSSAYDVILTFTDFLAPLPLMVIPGS